MYNILLTIATNTPLQNLFYGPGITYMYVTISIVFPLEMSNFTFHSQKLVWSLKGECVFENTESI